MDQDSSTIKRYAKYALWVLLGSIVLLLLIPIPSLKSGYSTVLLASGGQMLGAHIAEDGQWRFPLPDSIPDNVETCIRLFEDEHFYKHPGINPLSIGRAIRQNYKAGKVVSGGSTITMQLARIRRGNRTRTIGNKLIELFVTLQLELRYSKASILKQYAGLAPFGGNVVGIDAAAWRYYGRSAHLLSWAEAATLAVLPNAPSLIYPGKEQLALKKKRNILLLKLLSRGIIDQLEYDLSIDEPLPQKPYPLPNIAPHLLQYTMKDGQKERILKSTIDYQQQVRHQEIATRYHRQYHDNEVHNLAILSVDIASGEIMSYVGNSDCKNQKEGVNVDIIHAPRSSGSILKPFLFASAFDKGMIAPTSLIADIPTQIAGYTPKNFDKSYSGAVTSGDALTRSLNIPAVKLLQDYGLPKFHELLQDLHLKSINKPADHYGLSLILGGAEVTLFNLVSAYRGLSKSLQIYTENESQYAKSDYDLIRYHYKDKSKKALNNKSPINAGSIWQMLEVLSNVERPRAEAGWKSFTGGRKVAWKTGTSFGHRDAWAVGMDGTHVIGVWIGNADGEGRPGLTGLNYAGPVLFDVFGTLPVGEWYSMPYDNLDEVDICKHSGYRIGRSCTDTLNMTLPVGMSALSTCDYHQTVSTDTDGQYIVDPTCHPSSEIVQKTYFKLPPTQAYYYRRHSPDYKSIPPIKPGCESALSEVLEIIYPYPNADVSIPVDLNGERQSVIFSAAHSDPKSKVHWHLDNIFIKTTQGNHQLTIAPEIGAHTLYIIDQSGVERRRNFEVVK